MFRVHFSVIACNTNVLRFSRSLCGFSSPQQAYAAGPRQGCVVIFHALNADKMNCDRLFNLLCLYGNVERIKFLKTKEGAALVQMGDSVACERVVNNLHGAYAFDSRMQVRFFVLFQRFLWLLFSFFCSFFFLMFR